MATVRAIDRQAINLTRQGQLAVYPSSFGQEGAQVGAALALRPQDWMFPTYRETVAIVARGIPAAEAMPLFKGTWHAGWDPVAYRTMPHCTPIATQCLHAVGVGMAARTAGDDVVALAFCGDGGTSEGDFHEALNFAGVFHAPVVFLVQNNQYAISVPFSRQTNAPSIAHKGVGHGVASARVDGNDVLAVHTVVSAAVERARRGEGPTVVEALTYRMEPHTTADDAARYRTDEERERWLALDPLLRFDTFLTAHGLLDDEARAAADEAARSAAATFRAALFDAPSGDPLEIFQHVYVDPPQALLGQRDRLIAELARRRG